MTQLGNTALDAADIILHAYDSNDFSLTTGLMGKVIRLCEMSSELLPDQKDVVMSITETFLNSIIDRIGSGKNLFDFDSGVCGILWGIEFLISNGHVESDPKEILSDVNSLILSSELHALSTNEAKGLLFYVAADVCNCDKLHLTSDFNCSFLQRLLQAAPIGAAPEEWAYLKGVVDGLPTRYELKCKIPSFQH